MTFKELIEHPLYKNEFEKACALRLEDYAAAKVSEALDRIEKAQSDAEMVFPGIDSNMPYIMVVDEIAAIRKELEGNE